MTVDVLTVLNHNGIERHTVAKSLHRTSVYTKLCRLNGCTRFLTVLGPFTQDVLYRPAHCTMQPMSGQECGRDDGLIPLMISSGFETVSNLVETKRISGRILNHQWDRSATCQNHPSPCVLTAARTCVFSGGSRGAYTQHNIYSVYYLDRYKRLYIIYMAIRGRVVCGCGSRAARCFVCWLSATGSTSLPCILVARTTSDVNNSKHNSNTGNVNAGQEHNSRGYLFSRHVSSEFYDGAISTEITLLT